MTLIGVGRQTWKRTPSAMFRAIARRRSPVRRPRFARVAELAESQFVLTNPFCEAKQRKARRFSRRPTWIRAEKRAGAKQRILKADPQPARPRLTVRNAAQATTELPPNGLKYLLHAVQTNAADEMHAVGTPLLIRHVLPPHFSGRGG